MASDAFTTPVAREVWQTRYRARDRAGVRDGSIQDTWRRVAAALAHVEGPHRTLWEERFRAALADFRFLPGGRILAGAGSDRRLTLFNCFVMGRLEDSMAGIFRALEEAAITLQQGGGIGNDFSTLRPAGDPADATGGVASGPVSFMRVWDRMCETLLATSARRGAMMATLACDHPDIAEFVTAKADPAALRRFNLSVLVNDAFMQAVADDAPWPLQFPPRAGVRPSAHADASSRPAPRVYRTTPARTLWEAIMRTNYACAEPGVIFIDRVQTWNNLAYCEQILATNPCGEIPLPPYGACDLGSVNLTRFVEAPFTARAAIDWEGVRATARVAARLLDDVYEISAFPLPAQREAALRSRRIGLGITGLADALAMLGMRYGEDATLTVAETLMREICHAAYRASIELARERGPFPAFEASAYLQAPFVAALPADIREGIARFGIRNSHLTAIAPTGSISLLANNVSSGLEPIFAAEYGRRIRRPDGTSRVEPVVDHAVQRYRDITNDSRGVPPALVTAGEVAPELQLAMQAALQCHVDNAISKTITVSSEIPFERFRQLFERAYRLGLKGCTTFRPNPVTGAVLIEPPPVDRCCTMAEPVPLGP